MGQGYRQEPFGEAEKYYKKSKKQEWNQKEKVTYN